MLYPIPWGGGGRGGGTAPHVPFHGMVVAMVKHIHVGGLQVLAVHRLEVFKHTAVYQVFSFLFLIF
jgi:hypothetical protein